MKNLFDFLKQNSWIVVALLVFVLIGIPFALYLAKGGNFTSEKNSLTFPATPTPISLENLSVEKVSPANLSTTEFPPSVFVVFSRSVNDAEKQRVKILLKSVSGNTSWSDDKTATFSPTQGLLAETSSYSATVIYGNQSFSWVFTTTQAQTTTINPGLNAQTQLDNQWNQRQAQYKQNYPWLSSLPLSTDSYYVYFDKGINTFIASLYPSNSSSVSQDQQVSQIKQEVTTALQNIGVKTQDYKFQWTVTPGS